MKWDVFPVNIVLRGEGGGDQISSQSLISLSVIIDQKRSHT